jgi:hypothetical protein
LRQVLHGSRHAICKVTASGLNFRRRFGSNSETDKRSETGAAPVLPFHYSGKDARLKNPAIMTMFSIKVFNSKNKHRPLRLVLSIASLACICIAMATAMQGIHPPPAAPTLQQDRAELARLENDARVAEAHTADLRIAGARTDVEPPAPRALPVEEPAGEANVPPREELTLKPAPSKPVTSRAHGARTSSKRYQERQAELALQRQRALAAAQRYYAQQESGSFFGSIARALGFSGR